MGRWPEALAEGQRAIALYADLRGGLQGAYGYTSLARFHGRLGQYSEAGEALVQAKTRLAKLQRPQRNLEGEIADAESSIAYSQRRWEGALALARSGASFHGSAATDLDTALLAGLSKIRLGDVTAGMDECQRAIRQDKDKGRIVAASAGELALAEALSGRVPDAIVAALAQSALNFFEPLQNWEAVWRCHWILSGRAKSGTHADAARSAIQHLRQQWLDPTFTAYANRPDIKILLP
jgi:tetratricopeptide (TPR) repeat protein